MKNPIKLEKKHLMQTYARFPLVIERGKGCWVWDTEGNKYLDFLAGIGVNALGHRHPRILKALRGQAARVLHVSNLYHHPYQGPLAAALAKVTGLDRVFFCNSGSEAAEGAIKLARARAIHRDKDKFEVVALENSFHGRTIGALSATGQPKYRRDFEPLVPGFRFVRLNDVADLEAKVTRRTCAVLVEPVQGEGGVFELSREFLDATRALTLRHDALLICDEIQCGLGRTGRYLAAQSYGVKPDLVLLAKPLAGGLPLGAFLATEQVAPFLAAGMHGSTFGGGPLACCVALEFLAVLKEEKILSNVRRVGQYFRKRLLAFQKKYPFIREVRGRGLMLAIDLDRPSRPFVEQALGRGLIVNSTQDTVIRFLPPLIVGTREVDRACDVLDALFASA